MTVSTASRTARPGRWGLLVGGIVAASLLIGGLTAVVTAPLRPTPTPAVTTLPSRPPVGAPGLSPPGGPGRGGGPIPDFPGGSGQPGGPAPPAVVARVDGDVVVLMTPWGEQRVRLDPHTRVEKQVPAERSEIAPGQLVIVNGAPADGEIAASTIQILGSPPFPFPVPGPARQGE